MIPAPIGDPVQDAPPDTFPIFPLAGALLLPHGRLPLNIFEPRYLAMVEDALGNGRHVAMIQPDLAASPVYAGPALQRVGCLGRLTSFAETDDGRFLITLGGVMRFVVAEELPMRRGYRRVRGDCTGFAADLQPPDQGPGARLADRPALTAALRGYFARQSFEANWQALEAMSDSALVVTIAMGCPFAAQEKQALLEAPGLRERAETLLAILRIEMHAGDYDGAAERRPS